MAQNNLLWIILWLGRWPSFGKPACIALNDFLATKIIESYQAQINPIWMKTWDKKKKKKNECSLIGQIGWHIVFTIRMSLSYAKWMNTVWLQEEKKCNSYILANTIYIYIAQAWNPPSWIYNYHLTHWLTWHLSGQIIIPAHIFEQTDISTHTWQILIKQLYTQSIINWKQNK